MKSKATNRKQPEEKVCAICLEGLDDPECDSTQELPCKHSFHRACVQRLRERGMQQTCPMCRANLPDRPEKMIQDGLNIIIMIPMYEGSWGSQSLQQQQDIEEEVAAVKAESEARTLRCAAAAAAAQAGATARLEAALEAARVAKLIADKEKRDLFDLLGLLEKHPAAQKAAEEKERATEAEAKRKEVKKKLQNLKMERAELKKKKLRWADDVSSTSSGSSAEDGGGKLRDLDDWDDNGNLTGENIP